MKFQEKTLEVNITHELLNLADSWYWFLTDIPLWRYWRPRYRLPFLKYPKSTAGGFHITTEGKNDPTGEEGGGYDMRIKAGIGGHLLFIQFKMGDLIKLSPDPNSIFNSLPFDHYNFRINGTKTNQHFLLRDLANGVGAHSGNAVVYAFPLISDMEELERNSGKLIRRTKFISVNDIDSQANLNNVTINRNQIHNFRIGKDNMNRCEVNSDTFSFEGEDKTPDIIADIVAVKFYETLSFYISAIEKNYIMYGLDVSYITEGILRSFTQYLRYLLHYFEVNPFNVKNDSINLFLKYIDLKLESNQDFDHQFNGDEFSEYSNEPRDIEIVGSIFAALITFENYIRNSSYLVDDKIKINYEVPSYIPSILIPIRKNGIQLNINREYTIEDIEKIMYLVI